MSEYTRQLMHNVSHWFELADQRFENYDYPLWKRPLSAALWTAKHGVQTNCDHTARKYEDLLLGHLLNAAKIWYYERYGEENCKPDDESIAGIVLFKNIPIGLSVPLVSRQVTEDGQHVWIKFLTTNDDENPLSFLQKEVPVSGLTAKARTSFQSKIQFAVACTRKICTSARIVNLDDVKRRDMCHSVVEHLNIGATLLLQNTSGTRALAIWEFFFLTEILLKTYIFQNGEIPENIHSLIELRKTASRLGLKSPLTRLAELPSSGNAIQHRYAQRGATTLETVKIYEATLSVGAELITEIQKSIEGENFALKVQKSPGWLFPPV